MKIAIVDYGMGNIHSVARALAVASPNAQVMLATTAKQIQQADRVVFPGQGAMGDCLLNLEKSGLTFAVKEALQTKPVLGICVGEQMLFEGSEEGAGQALHVFPGFVKRFAGTAFEQNHQHEPLKVPHMGWNQVAQVQAHPLWHQIADHSYFYFVHSYYVDEADASLVVGQSLYGIHFTCAVARDNIFACQFHPEKSAHNGLQLLKNFVAWQV